MRSMQRPLAWLLSLMLAVLPVLPAQAAMVGTEQIISPAAHARSAETRLRQFLDQEAARQQLQAWGVSPAWVDARVNSLSDSELAQINQTLDDVHAGGTSILGVLLVIFIVFVITDVIGATNIFPFIHPVR
jgi:hypothetical protein